MPSVDQEKIGFKVDVSQRPERREVAVLHAALGSIDEQGLLEFERLTEHELGVVPSPAAPERDDLVELCAGRRHFIVITDRSDTFEDPLLQDLDGPEVRLDV